MSFGQTSPPAARYLELLGAFSPLTVTANAFAHALTTQDDQLRARCVAYGVAAAPRRSATLGLDATATLVSYESSTPYEELLARFGPDMWGQGLTDKRMTRVDGEPWAFGERSTEDADIQLGLQTVRARIRLSRIDLPDLSCIVYRLADDERRGIRVNQGYLLVRRVGDRTLVQLLKLLRVGDYAIPLGMSAALWCSNLVQMLAVASPAMYGQVAAMEMQALVAQRSKATAPTRFTLAPGHHVWPSQDVEARLAGSPLHLVGGTRLEGRLRVVPLLGGPSFEIDMPERADLLGPLLAEGRAEPGADGYLLVPASAAEDDASRYQLCFHDDSTPST